MADGMRIRWHQPDGAFNEVIAESWCSFIISTDDQLFCYAKLIAAVMAMGHVVPEWN